MNGATARDATAHVNGATVRDTTAHVNGATVRDATAHGHALKACLHNKGRKYDDDDGDNDRDDDGVASCDQERMTMLDDSINAVAVLVASDPWPEDEDAFEDEGMDEE